MTTVKILGQDEPTQVEKKKIEFVKCLTVDNLWSEILAEPASYRNIELICKSYTREGLDVMFAFNDNCNHELDSALYLGHFNDGIV